MTVKEIFDLRKQGRIEEAYEEARQLQAMGRPSSHATREEALRQVQMLQAARGAWEYNSKHYKG